MICVKNKTTPDFPVAWEQKLSTRGHQALQDHSHEPELPWFYFSSKRLAITTCCIFSQVITHILFFTLVYFIGVGERISATTLFYRSWNCKSSHNATWYIAVSSCLKFTFTIEAFDFLGHFCPFFSLQMFRKLHVAYTDMFCNPFYNPGENITSRWDRKKYRSFVV